MASINYIQIINLLGSILLFYFILKTTKIICLLSYKQRVRGSNPCAPTMIISHLWRFTTYVAFFKYPTICPTILNWPPYLNIYFIKWVEKWSGNYYYFLIFDDLINDFWESWLIMVRYSYCQLQSQFSLSTFTHNNFLVRCGYW